eukprot:GHVU01079796.1.p1 GENE.GHVU01079796.1~~GHVU01079796.1.p1  ORF type:complete len:148 (+),score=5.10 GHVU01079796.1:122-565(+)
MSPQRCYRKVNGYDEEHGQAHHICICVFAANPDLNLLLRHTLFGARRNRGLIRPNEDAAAFMPVCVRVCPSMMYVRTRAGRLGRQASYLVGAAPTEPGGSRSSPTAVHPTRRQPLSETTTTAANDLRTRHPPPPVLPGWMAAGAIDG